MYCIDCGKELPVGASFCAYCGGRVPAGATPEPESGRENEATRRPLSPQRGESSAKVPPEVPHWVGWVGFGMFILGLVSLLLPWLVFSYWCYRRGRYEGASLAEGVEPPLPYFPARLTGWLLASVLLPFVDWFTAVHVPTLCYQQGRRVGASKGEASESFTTALEMALAAVIVTAVVWSVVVWSVVAARAYERFATNDNEQATTEPSVSQSPTPLTGQDLKDVCASWLQQATNAGAIVSGGAAECLKCGGRDFMAVDGEWVQEPWPHAILYVHCAPTGLRWDEESDPTVAACLALAKSIPVAYALERSLISYQCFECGGPASAAVDEDAHVTCREPESRPPIDWSKIPRSE